MRQIIIYILASVACLLVSVSCIDRPEIVLDDEQMADLLVDIHRSEGLLEVQGTGGLNKEEYQQAVMASVLVKHGVTREQYDSSLMWYAKHLKLFVRVYSHVEERLNEEHDEWNLLVSESRDFDVSEAGDSIELWTLRDYLVLDAGLYSSVRFWELKADSNYQAGDTLRWSFDVSKLTKGQKLFASMAFRAREEDFENAPTKYRDERISQPVGSASLLIDNNGAQQFYVVPDSAKAFSSVLLNLTLISSDSVPSPTFLREVSLKRYHRR